MPFIQTLDPAEIESLPEKKQGHGALVTELGNLPLKAMDIKATVVGLLSKTEVRQTYVNTTDEHLEATYIFPLPDRAGVSRFRLEVGERVITGELQERAKARQAYTQAIAAGHRAAIAEEERADVFTMRVGNIPPGEEVTIWFDMAGPLDTSAGSATYRFPLVVAPRYVPGSALPGPSVGTGTAADTDQVPDASRITPPTLLPGHKSPVQLTLELTFDPAGIEAQRVRTIAEAGECVQEGDLHTVTLKPGQKLNQDFLFRFDFLHPPRGEKPINASLLIERDAPGSDEGTLMLTACGPDQREHTTPKDVIFVLDRSGSMGGWKMVAARRACADLIDKLGPQDRFDVIAFDTTTEHPFGASMNRATPHNRYVATEWLGTVDARGGTEIARPLFHALQSMPSDDEREQTIVLITDGQVGNDREVVRIVQDNLGGLGKRRVFTLGIDRAVSAGFLKALAQVGNGRCELVESPERLDEVLDEFAKQIGGPFVEDLAFFVEGCQIDQETVSPQRGHHLYPSVPLMVTARFSGLAELEAVKASVKGILPSIEVRESTGKVLAPAWARARLREMEDQWAAGQGAVDHDLESKIVELSLKYSVLCRFTAFVAIDKAEVVNKGGEQTQVTQAVEHPAGWAGQTCGGVLMSQQAGLGGYMHLDSMVGMGYAGGGGRSSMMHSPGPGGQHVNTSYNLAAMSYSGPMGDTGVQGMTGPAGPQGPQGVQAGFRGFAPGFDPNARWGGPTRHRGGGGGMRVVPIPAIGGPPTDHERRRVLELVNRLLKWPGKKSKKGFWKRMKELSELLALLSRPGQAMIPGTRAISPVLRSSLNTAISNKKWTDRTKRTLEAIRDELVVLLDPARVALPRPRNDAFWK